MLDPNKKFDWCLVGLAAMLVIVCLVSVLKG